MSLAGQTRDLTLVDEAIRDMRRALQLNPQWPEGWALLARMAATGGEAGDRPALRRTAIEAVDRALALEDRWPGEVSPTLSAQDRAELLSMREYLSHQLEATASQPTATQRSR
jgi:hypothetical protein